MAVSIGKGVTHSAPLHPAAIARQDDFRRRYRGLRLRRPLGGHGDVGHDRRRHSDVLRLDQAARQRFSHLASARHPLADGGQEVAAAAAPR